MHTASIKKTVQKIKNDIFGFSGEHMLLFPTWMQIKTPQNTEGGLYFSIALWLLFLILVLLVFLIFIANKYFKTKENKQNEEKKEESYDESFLSKILIFLITILLCYLGSKACIQIVNPDLSLLENLRLIWNSNIKNLMFENLVSWIKDNNLLNPDYKFYFEYESTYLNLIVFFKLRYLYFITFTSLFLRWKLKITKKTAQMLSSLPLFFKVVNTLDQKCLLLQLS